MQVLNEVCMTFPSKSQNESFARGAVAAFVLQLDPTYQEMADIKTVVSEAVTNAIIHGYEGNVGRINVTVRIIEGHGIQIVIEDDGVGIEDIQQAMTPLFTSKPHLERSGMGFTIMQQFMDSVEVYSKAGKGTTVTMYKQLQRHANM